MFQIDNSTSVAVKPTPEAAGTPGFFTNGDPVGGIPATIVEADFLNMVQDELIAILTAAGVTPSKTTYNQILAALPAALASRPEMARSLTANGYQKLPGGLILQWGSVATNASGVATPSFPIAFPNACLFAGTCDAETVGTALCYGGVAFTSTVLSLIYARGGAATNASTVVWFAVGW